MMAPLNIIIITNFFLLNVFSTYHVLHYLKCLIDHSCISFPKALLILFFFFSLMLEKKYIFSLIKRGNSDYSKYNFGFIKKRLSNLSAPLCSSFIFSVSSGFN